MDSSSSAITLPALPETFPEGIRQPRFQIGDRVQWQPCPTQDFGIIVGLQYAPAPHLQAWAWKYIVWLDVQSPSHSWTSTDSAWEVDLEPHPTTVIQQPNQEAER